jgi:ATP-dependent helicase/nuclease subunit A
MAALQRDYFRRPPEELCADLRAVAPLVRELSGLVLEFGETYRRVKLARSVLDFNDLEHYCLQILEERDPDAGVSSPSAVALELQERFEEVLVDEYQDINAVQEAILQLVSARGKRVRICLW